MPINAFGKSSNNPHKRIDTNLFVQKRFLRTKSFESNIQEDIDLKNQYRKKITWSYIHTRSNSKNLCYNEPSITRKTAHVDFIDKSLITVRFIKVISFPAIPEHLTAKNYVGQAISGGLDESSLLRLDPDEKSKLDEQDSIVVNSFLKLSKTIIDLPTKSYVDSLLENSKNRRDLSSVFTYQANDFDNIKLNILDCITVNKSPELDNELSNKNFVDDELDKNTILRFIPTLEEYVKISVGKNVYNPTKRDKRQITTSITFPNTGGYLPQQLYINCNDKNINGKIQNFIKATKTNSPTGHSGAKILPPIGIGFMYIETIYLNHGSIVFCSFERTDIIQISNITF